MSNMIPLEGPRVGFDDRTLNALIEDAYKLLGDYIALGNNVALADSLRGRAAQIRKDMQKHLSSVKNV